MSFIYDEYRKLKNWSKGYSDAMKEIEDLHVEFFGTDIRGKR